MEDFDIVVFMSEILTVYYCYNFLLIFRFSFKYL